MLVQAIVSACHLVAPSDSPNAANATNATGGRAVLAVPTAWARASLAIGAGGKSTAAGPERESAAAIVLTWYGELTR